MTLSKEDLQAIKGVVEESVSDLKEDVSVLKEDVSGLKTRMDVLEEDVRDLKEDVRDLKEDVGTLKEDVGTLKEDVGTLKEDVGTLKEDVGALKEDVGTLKEDVGALKTKMQKAEENITKIQVVQIEKCLIPSVKEIVEYQKSTYDRYNKSADLFEEKIVILDTLEDVVKTHSKQIKELQLKQA